MGVSIRPVIMPNPRTCVRGIALRTPERDPYVDYIGYVWTDGITVIASKDKVIK